MEYQNNNVKPLLFQVGGKFDSQIIANNDNLTMERGIPTRIDNVHVFVVIQVGAPSFECL